MIKKLIYVYTLPYTLLQYKVSNRAKSEALELAGNVRALVLVSILFHIISIAGSALYFSTIVPNLFTTSARILHYTLSDSFKAHIFLYSVVVGGTGSFILELATIRVFADGNKGTIGWLLALGLSVFQVFTMYAGIVNTTIEYSIPDSVYEKKEQLKAELNQKNDLVFALNKKLNDFSIKDNATKMDLVANTNKELIKSLEDRIADAKANLLDIKQMFKAWQNNLVAKYKLATIEELKTSYRTKYPFWEQKSGYPAKIAKIEAHINDLSLQLANARADKTTKTKEDVLEDFRNQIKIAQKEADILDNKLLKLENWIIAKKAKTEKFLSDNKKYFLAGALFVLLLQSLLAAKTNNDYFLLTSKVDRIKDNHKTNTRRKSIVEEKQEENNPIPELPKEDWEKMLEAMKNYYTQYKTLPSNSILPKLLGDGYKNKVKILEIKKSLIERGYIETEGNNTKPTDKFLDLLVDEM